eukprot:6773703-Pyramimonas_sp.AAC.1
MRRPAAATKPVLKMPASAATAKAATASSLPSLKYPGAPKTKAPPVLHNGYKIGVAFGCSRRRRAG